MKPHIQAAIATLVAFRLIAQTVAQTPALPQATEPPTPVLRVTTRLVQVSVIVTGKKSEPVTGLTKDDFVVLDKGKPQQIQFFSEEAYGVLPPQKDQKPLPVNVFSNGANVADLRIHSSYKEVRYLKETVPEKKN